MAAAIAVAYVIVQPSSVDLAAQSFRADLFSVHGFLLWNDYWYGGHYLLPYSVLFPPLAALLGVRVVGALSAVAIAALFAALAYPRYGERAWLATLWLGAATATMLMANRLTFALGTAIGMAALLAVQRRHPVVATALAAVSGLGSPVAALFVAVAGAALAVTGSRRTGMALACAALLPVIVLALAFPTGGYFPFVFTAFLPVPLFAAAALLLLPPRERVLRAGVLVYAGLCIFLFAFHTQIGANAARLGSLFGGPILALGLAGRRPVALAVVALPILWWQWVAPVRDIAAAWDEPSTSSGYYRPLLAELDRLAGGRPVRIEVPPTRNRFESEYIAPRFPLSRGWLRQSESGDFHLFTGNRLSPASYRAWLQDQGVTYVALADAAPDYLAKDEDDLIRGGLGYLRPVWSNDHWHLYRLRGAVGLVSTTGQRPRAASGARVSEVDPQSFTLAVRKPGAYLVRFHYTPYWTVTAGNACTRDDRGWTRVDLHSGGRVEVAARFSGAGLLRRRSECSG